MKYALCSILLIYYFFTSGICYEIASPNVINHIEAPYNIGLSAERTGITDIATQDDIKALNWLKNTAQNRRIVGDYNSYCLVHGFLQNHVEYLRYGSLTDIKKGDLVFLTEWNVRNNAYIEPNGVGTREVYDLPDFSKGYRVVYETNGEVSLMWSDGTLHESTLIRYRIGPVVLEKE